MNSGRAPIGIIGAMESELEHLLKEMDHIERIIVSGMCFHCGLYQGISCVVTQCGVGKVNAAVYTQTLLLRFSPRLVINVGVAGGVGPDVHIGDLVLADACVQHDFDISALGAQKGEIEIQGKIMTKIPCDTKTTSCIADHAREIYQTVHRGIVATGDAFVADNTTCTMLHRQHGALACEMEGGSIAHVCYINRVPVAVLRSISDNGNDAAKVDFRTFARQSAEKSQALMKLVLPVL